MDYYQLTFVAIFGAIIGSFLNVVIYRIPLILQAQDSAPENHLNLFLPRSHCPNCKSEIRVIDNIPILSYLLLRGKCHACLKTISARYVLVEIASVFLSLAIVIKFGLSLAALYGIILCSTLIALFVIDLQHMLLPDNLTLFGLWVGLYANITSTFTFLPDAVLGAIVGYLMLWSVFWMFKILTKKDGLGYGDFKLLAMLGAWFGVASLPFILLTSSCLAIVGICSIAFYKKIPLLNTHFAFGPYLALAGAGYLLAT